MLSCFFGAVSSVHTVSDWIPRICDPLNRRFRDGYAEIHLIFDRQNLVLSLGLKSMTQAKRDVTQSSVTSEGELESEFVSIKYFLDHRERKMKICKLICEYLKNVIERRVIHKSWS